MSRKALKPALAAHPLPQSGGSFTVEAGALIPAQSPKTEAEAAAELSAVKPVSKEA